MSPEEKLKKLQLVHIAQSENKNVDGFVEAVLAMNKKFNLGSDYLCITEPTVYKHKLLFQIEKLINELGVIAESIRYAPIKGMDNRYPCHYCGTLVHDCSVCDPCAKKAKEKYDEDCKKVKPKKCNSR